MYVRRPTSSSPAPAPTTHTYPCSDFLLQEKKIRRTVTACQSAIFSLQVLPGNPQASTTAARGLGGVLIGGGGGTLSYFDHDLIKQAHVDLKVLKIAACVHVCMYLEEIGQDIDYCFSCLHAYAYLHTYIST